MIDRRIPSPTQPILEKYKSLVDERLLGLIHAFCIVGSIALGGFNERFSDIDFVAVVDHPASQGEIESLRAIHKMIENDFPIWKLSGSYLQQEDLGKPNDEIAAHLHYHDGKLNERNSGVNSITSWELKNHGIALWGMEPQDFPFTVDWDPLVRWVRENLNSYWRAWTTRPGRIVVMLSDWGIQWAVLGVLRQYYTLRENSITTKIGAGEYALTCLPSRWHPLIQEAMDIRAGRKHSRYRSPVLRMIDAVKFLRYVIEIALNLLCSRSW